MRTWTALLSVTVAALASAGCGSTTKSASTPEIPGVKRYKPLPPPKSVTYTASLSGASGISSPRAPAGAPHASGLAFISVKAPTLELCWSFSQLKNVPAPTKAFIYRAASLEAWRYGFRLGNTYKASGCLPENRIFLTLLGIKPEQFYVSIRNARFPLGAVRGQF
jgi:hypothetical protein